MQGSMAIACGLSLWSKVARKSDTQQEPPVAGTASSKLGPPFLGCFCSQSLPANARQLGAMVVASAAPEKGEVDTDASIAHENSS